MLNKTNFKSQYGQDLKCRLCPEEESQAHLLSCKAITQDIDTSNIKYDDIFLNVKKQEVIAKIYTQILKIRNTKIRILSH